MGSPLTCLVEACGEIVLVFCKGISRKGEVYALQKKAVTARKWFTESFLSLRSTPLVKTTQKQKSHVKWLFCFWWSRGESNPCPKIYSHIFLRVHSVYWVSEYHCRQTGLAIRIALSHDCYKRQFTVHVHRLFDTSAEVAVVLGEMRCNLGSECYVFVSV